MTAERLQISQGTSQGVRPEPKGEEERKTKLGMSDMRRLVPGCSIRPQPAGLDAIPPRLRQAEKYNFQMSTWAIYLHTLAQVMPPLGRDHRIAALLPVRAQRSSVPSDQCSRDIDGSSPSGKATAAGTK